MNLDLHVTEDLSAYLAGELTEEDRSRVETHLLQCDACQTELNKQKRLSELLDSATHLSPRPELLRGVLQQVTDGSKIIGFRKRTVISWLAAAAAIAAVLFLLRIQKDASVPGEQVKVKPPVVQPEIKPQPEPESEPKIVPKQSQTDSAPQIVEQRPKERIVPPEKVPEEIVPPTISPEEADLIAQLDELENMDLISNYENLENMEIALLGEGGERLQ